jgi:D-alanine-D-alanine ligase
MGEDGRIQGLLEIANLPYTGMRVLASALLMDKIATKRFLEVSGIPQLPFAEIRRPKQGRLLTVAELAPMVGNIAFPACIKPVNLGSSIGVAKVAGLEELADIVPDIFKYDDRAMLEPFVQNLAEYNIAVARLGARITTSAIERPRSTEVLLDFKTKYLSGPSDKTGQKTPGSSSQGMLSLTRDINPTIPKDMETNIRQWASRCFELVGGTGSPRLDFLCNEATGEVWFNEVNPCPGSFAYFLWENAAEPLLFSQLLDHLIQEGRGLHAAVQLPSDPTPVDARLFPRRG